MAVLEQAKRRKMSLEEFLRMPEGPPFYEFEEGEAIPVVSPTQRHQEISLVLATVIRDYIRERNLGKVWQALDVHLASGKIYIPDVVYLSRQHLERCHVQGDGKIHGAPDLIVEILSPGSVARDRVTKFNAYFAAGVPWLWLVDPDTLLIEEFHSEQKGYTRTAAAAAGEPFRPEAFPGLEIDLQANL